MEVTGHRIIGQITFSVLCILYRSLWGSSVIECLSFFTPANIRHWLQPDFTCKVVCPFPYQRSGVGLSRGFSSIPHLFLKANFSFPAHVHTVATVPLYFTHIMHHAPGKAINFISGQGACILLECIRAKNAKHWIIHSALLQDRRAPLK